jgi:hypothetical protein
MVYSLVNSDLGPDAPYTGLLMRIISKDSNQLACLTGSLAGILPPDNGLEDKDISDFIRVTDIKKVNKVILPLDFGGPVYDGMQFVSIPLGDGVSMEVNLESFPLFPSYQKNMKDIRVDGLQAIITPRHGITYVSLVPPENWQALRDFDCGPQLSAAYEKIDRLEKQITVGVTKYNVKKGAEVLKFSTKL